MTETFVAHVNGSHACYRTQAGIDRAFIGCRHDTPREAIHEAHELSRLERGRALTDAEVACYLADRQTALRHATAHVGDEIAEMLRDRLADRQP